MEGPVGRIRTVQRALKDIDASLQELLGHLNEIASAQTERDPGVLDRYSAIVYAMAELWAQKLLLHDSLLALRVDLAEHDQLAPGKLPIRCVSGSSTDLR